MSGMGRLFASRLRALLVLLAVVAVAAAAITVARTTGDSDDDNDAKRAPANRAAFRPDDTTLDECKKRDRDCLEQAYGNLAFNDGAGPALKRLAADMRTDPTINSLCHPIAHSLGAGALLRNDGDVGLTFTEGDTTCWSGFYHGVLERAFAGVPKAKVGATAAKLCESQQVRSSRFLLYQCVHGLGHGLMIHTGYDLMGSLKVCEQIANDWESVSCDGGVFMENVVSSRGRRSPWLRDDDGIYPCQQVAHRHKYYCYLMATSRIGELNGYDWADTANTCSTRAEAGYKGTCFESYGRDASGQNRTNLPQVWKLCTLGKEFAVSCVYGAVRDMASQDANGVRAARFCGIVPKTHRGRCFEGLGTILSDQVSDRANLAPLCRGLAGPYTTRCLHGGGVRA